MFDIMIPQLHSFFGPEVAAVFGVDVFLRDYGIVILARFLFGPPRVLTFPCGGFNVENLVAISASSPR